MGRGVKMVAPKWSARRPRARAVESRESILALPKPFPIRGQNLPRLRCSSQATSPMRFRYWRKVPLQLIARKASDKYGLILSSAK